MKKHISFVAFCVLCFCVFYGIRYLENPVESQSAIYETYENKIDTSGYIVCNEQVYTAPTSGTVYHYVQEGTRVKKGRVLMAVYSGGVSADTLSELESISKKIAELENTGSSYTVAASSGEGDIQNIKDNIIKARRSNNVSKMSEYKAQINSIITGTIHETEGNNIDALRAKKQAIEAGISGSKNDIYSQMSGVFSKNVDGLEGILTPKSIMTYRLADYNAISEAVKDYNTNAEWGQPVCKVVNNHSWYVILTVDELEAQRLKTGGRVGLRFTRLPGIEAEATVEYISKEESGIQKNVVVLKCEQYKEGVFSTRFSEIELILESYEGFRVPISAIRINDDKTGVMVRNTGAQIFKECKVVYTDTKGQTVIIAPVAGSSNPLREYDNIVVGEK